MKKSFAVLLVTLVCGLSAFAQMPGGGASPGMDSSMEKLFKDNPVFTATMSANITAAQGPMTASSKMYYDHGNSRMEMNLANVTGASLPPNAAAQMKAMGMDEIVTIAPAAKTNVYMIYPNLHSYLSMSVPPASTPDSNVQITKLGEETVAGHPCVKNKVVVTVNNQPHEFTVWNATDMKNFPVQISLNDQGTSAIMTFQSVSFASIPASEFQPPSGYTQYGSPMEMMQAIMASHGGGAGGAPAPNQ